MIKKRLVLIRPRIGFGACLMAALCIGLTVTGCGKKEVAKDDAMAAAQAGKATPRNYVVDGKIDLQAMTATLREYVIWKKGFPKDLNEMVTSGFVSSLPKPPPGKRFAIYRGPMMYEVILVNQ
ncbi:MAG: hypothetical protein M1608_11265 [Candidatus Omnitrophica bacterium]|nr:hypothetical protein [Candidatus Omnitrophota bacterium]